MEPAESDTRPVRGFLVWKGRRYNIVEGDNIIGSAKACDIVLEHNSVCDRHANISCRDGIARITDLCTQGTAVCAIGDWTQLSRYNNFLRLGDRNLIRLGMLDTEFQFVEEGVGAGEQKECIDLETQMMFLPNSGREEDTELDFSAPPRPKSSAMDQDTQFFGAASGFSAPSAAQPAFRPLLDSLHPFSSEKSQKSPAEAAHLEVASHGTAYSFSGDSGTSDRKAPSDRKAVGAGDRAGAASPGTDCSSTDDEGAAGDSSVAASIVPATTSAAKSVSFFASRQGEEDTAPCQDNDDDAMSQDLLCLASEAPGEAVAMQTGDQLQPPYPARNLAQGLGGFGRELSIVPAKTATTAGDQGDGEGGQGKDGSDATAAQDGVEATAGDITAIAESDSNQSYQDPSPAVLSQKTSAIRSIFGVTGVTYPHEKEVPEFTSGEYDNSIRMRLNDTCSEDATQGQGLNGSVVGQSSKDDVINTSVAVSKAFEPMIEEKAVKSKRKMASSAADLVEDTAQKRVRRPSTKASALSVAEGSASKPAEKTAEKTAEKPKAVRRGRKSCEGTEIVLLDAAVASVVEVPQEKPKALKRGRKSADAKGVMLDDVAAQSTAAASVTETVADKPKSAKRGRKSSGSAEGAEGAEAEASAAGRLAAEASAAETEAAEVAERLAAEAAAAVVPTKKAAVVKRGGKKTGGAESAALEETAAPSATADASVGEASAAAVVAAEAPSEKQAAVKRGRKKAGGVESSVLEDTAAPSATADASVGEASTAGVVAAEAPSEKPAAVKRGRKKAGGAEDAAADPVASKSLALSKAQLEGATAKPVGAEGAEEFQRGRGGRKSAKGVKFRTEVASDSASVGSTPPRVKQGPGRKRSSEEPVSINAELSAPSGSSSSAEDIKVMFTKMTTDLKLLKHYTTELLKIPNVSVTDDPAVATHCVTTANLKRTPNLMLGINLGVKYIVTEQWVKDCVGASAAVEVLGPAGKASGQADSRADAELRTRLQSSPYLVQDVEKEQLWQFSMATTLAIPRGAGAQAQVFAGFCFFCTKGVFGPKVQFPPEKEIRALIESGGGSWLPSLNEWKKRDQQSETLVVLSLEGVQKDVTKAVLDIVRSSASDGRIKGVYVATDLLFLSCLRQNMDLDQNILVPL